VADCARRTAEGELVLRPGVATDDGGPQAVLVEDEHGGVRGGTWGVIDRAGRIVVPVAHDRGSVPSPG